MLEQMLVKSVKEYPEKTAIVYNDLRINYTELYSRVRGLSKGLSSIGIGQNDCIAIILPNCPEFVISFYAAAKLKARVLTLNYLFKEDEISYYISDSNTSVIITETKQADILRSVILKLNKKIELIIVDGLHPLTTYFYDLIFPETTDDSENQVPFEGYLLYQYSSGSTGRPKRVCRTQKNLYHEANNFTETINLTSSDNILCIVPLYHAHGLGNCLLATICKGATLVILEQFLSNGTRLEVPFVFRRSRVLELIEGEKISVLPAVPYIFDILAETPAHTRADLSTLRLCFSAGNLLSKDIFYKFLQRFGISIKQLYGCTEAGSVSINLDCEPEKSYDSVGFPMINVEIKIINDEDKELPVSMNGEVKIKSQALTSGYCNMPELNQQAFKDGWFLTGDLGKKDEFGRFYITGRKKIFIDTGGRKVDPLEIEDILITHPKVKEAVVVGVKDVYAGEIIKAVIVQKDMGKCEEKEIKSYCKERLAEFKIPRIIEFRDEIPKNPLGKILRKDLV